MIDPIEIKKRFTAVHASTTFNRIIKRFGLGQKKALDLGCGFGEYLVKFGPGSVGVTTTDDEVAYGKAQSINIVKGNVEFIDTLPVGGNFELIWANNLFEHLIAPHAFLIRLKKVARADTILILGVPVIPKIVSLISLKKFRGVLASNHINFFTKKSLELTVEFAGWDVIEARPFISGLPLLDKFFGIFAPHMYVVARNNAAFRYPEKKRKEWQGEEYYKGLFAITDEV